MAPKEGDELARLPCLRTWFRTRSAIVLHLTNGTMQVRTRSLEAGWPLRYDRYDRYDLGMTKKKGYDRYDQGMTKKKGYDENWSA